MPEPIFTPHFQNPGAVSGKRQRKPHIDLRVYDAQIAVSDEARLAISKWREAEYLDKLDSTTASRKALKAAEAAKTSALQRVQIMKGDVAKLLAEFPPTAAPGEEPAPVAVIPPAPVAASSPASPAVAASPHLLEISSIMATTTGAARDAMAAILAGDLPESVKLLQIRNLKGTME